MFPCETLHGGRTRTRATGTAPSSEPWVLGLVLPLTVTSNKSPVPALLWASVLLHKTHLYKEGLESKFH